MHIGRWECRPVKIAAQGWFRGGKLDGAEFDQVLNALGADGWELVSVLATTQYGGESRDIAAVFKRPGGA